MLQELEKDNLNEIVSDNDTVVVQYMAGWCGNCRLMKPKFKKLASENERRAKLLLEKQAISQEEYDVASADFQSAKAESDLIAAQLSKTSIRAPFSGTIGLRSISKGSYVTPTTMIAKLVNTTKLKLTFSIPEKYASRMRLNGAFTFTTTSSNKEYTAEIYAIEPEVDIATRLLSVDKNDAIRMFQEMIAGKDLNSQAISIAYYNLSKAYFFLDEYDEALKTIKDGLINNKETKHY